MTTSILCAVDLTHLEADRKILKKAADLATHFGAKLAVVTVVPDYGMTIVGSYFKDGTMKEALVEANKQLHAFVADTVANADAVQHIVEKGNVYEQVLAATERAGADLVVIGAHKPDLAERVQGPNSARVARHAKVSVLVVRD